MIDFLSENIGFRRDLHPAVLAGVAIMVLAFISLVIYRCTQEFLDRRELLIDILEHKIRTIATTSDIGNSVTNYRWWISSKTFGSAFVPLSVFKKLGSGRYYRVKASTIHGLRLYSVLQEVTKEDWLEANPSPFQKKLAIFQTKKKPEISNNDIDLQKSFEGMGNGPHDYQKQSTS